jgi:hypothetical protein
MMRLNQRSSSPRQEGVDRPEAGATDDEGEGDTEAEEMILEAFTLLGAVPAIDWRPDRSL